jgi:hypothetical protein
MPEQHRLGPEELVVDIAVERLVQSKDKLGHELAPLQ